jgi:hypothetical protein
MLQAASDCALTLLLFLSFRSLSPSVVLSIFGNGSFWNREVFSAIATVEESSPIYMEIYLPMLAHHLGFRVRDFAGQNRFVRVLKDECNNVERARKQGGEGRSPLNKRFCPTQETNSRQGEEACLA